MPPAGTRALARPESELKRRAPPDVKSGTCTSRRALRASVTSGPVGGRPCRRIGSLMRLGERLSDVADMYGTTAPKPQVNDCRWSGCEGLQAARAEVEPRAGRARDAHGGGLGDSLVYAIASGVFYSVADGESWRKSRSYSDQTDEICSGTDLTRRQAQRGCSCSCAYRSTPTSQTVGSLRTRCAARRRVGVLNHETQQNRVGAGSSQPAIPEVASRRSISGARRAHQQFSRKRSDPDSEIRLRGGATKRRKSACISPAAGRARGDRMKRPRRSGNGRAARHTSAAARRGAGASPASARARTSRK